ncbi:hypothetical protein KPL76_10160 [Subtercola sp. PAMC28395]|uniref:hypothetical protein n=1 Tax=Subtercola sp. PAMC28395 TaxID=2846775 RepID=UPI001C0C5CAB|nr:hypothetical protein [Subtercola sp. PAMC28395]QWT23112.1 hypothetical protein KPL76_10160 [Subtercola sp. PAMC28395]
MTLTSPSMPSAADSLDSSSPDSSSPDASLAVAAATDVSELAVRLDAAVQGIRSLDPGVQVVAEQFALALDALSRVALTTIVKALRADPRGTELLFELLDDEAVRMLLGMYGIIRLPDPEQAQRAAAGLGADGVAPAPAKAGRAFISLDSMLRGPSEQTGGGCGTAGDSCGPESCVCGDH